MKKINFILITCFFILYANIAPAANPPKEPILKIEIGMHTAKIWRIGVDMANRFLVTGSQDKTVRVWELPSGRLLTVLRPPIGAGREGAIYAVAISPDGKRVACGGWTQFADQKDKLAADGMQIYLFDRATGKLSYRIAGLPDVIRHLSFSPDGTYLAAALGGWPGGIRIFRAADGALIGKGKDCRDSSPAVIFDRQNRIATSSDDGNICLYAPPGPAGLRLLTMGKAPGGKRPESLAFSPDGKLLVAGFRDSSRVNVLSAEDLSFLYAPDTTGVDDGSLSNVAFSADGRHLYAGGTYKRGDQLPIFAWDAAGKGARRELSGAANTIMDILPLKAGGIIYGTADPAFGVIDKNHTRVLFQNAQIADLRLFEKGLKISDDGKTVSFSYESGGKVPASFNVDARALIPGPDAQGLYSPDTTSLAVTDWEGSYTPKLNGSTLELHEDASRSLAVSPGKSGLLLGANVRLSYFDQEGREKWTTLVPATAWAVNIARNSKVAAAGFGDGTIRWYNMAGGQELLAFFPHKDRKRWVLWTPSGYYDASPGAEELIGWHLNQGKDQAADFFPASRFRSTHYRPDVIAKILETQDESEAVRLANAESGRKLQKPAIATLLPPVVTILSPVGGSNVSTADVTLSVSVRSPAGAPVTSIRALVDGRPVSTERGLSIKPKGDTIQQIRVTIPERDAEVSIIAENRHAASEPATIRLRWQGKAEKDEFVIKPKLYVLSIGVSSYDDRGLTLGFAAKDAKDFSLSMQKQKGGLYRDVTVKLLMDKQATKEEILDGLEWIQRETTSKDIAMVFLAGHGVNDSAGIYYFLPVNTDTEKLKRTGVSFSDIKNTVASLAGKAVLFVDTCHAGNVMGTRRGTADINAVVNELASAENGAVVFASSTGKQYSMEDKSWGNGAFTKALVEGMAGQADYRGQGRITINMLDLYLSERVKELTGGKQTPTTTKPQTIPDFPVAVKR
ncbi:MAG: caspase family protein [Syntrophales bacterium]|nr:caspase family protein [Syntrophales bacterium]